MNFTARRLCQGIKNEFADLTQCQARIINERMNAIVKCFG